MRYDVGMETFLVTVLVACAGWMIFVVFPAIGIQYRRVMGLLDVCRDLARSDASQGIYDRWRARYDATDEIMARSFVSALWPFGFGATADAVERKIREM